VTAVDARSRLGLPARPADQSGVHVIVTERGEKTSLMVDRASDVVTLRGADRRPVPETVPAEIRRLVTAVHQQRGGLILLLDLTLALSTT